MFAAGRAFEQVRNSIAYPKINVKIGATHGGISVGEDHRGQAWTQEEELLCIHRRQGNNV